jgi:hypothetical protein
VLHRATAPLATARVGDTIEYAHAGFCERYAVRADGVEQSFEFAAPLRGSGDLIVRGRVACSEPGAIEADGALVWSRRDSGGTRIRGVVGIDADGDRVTGSLRLDGDHVEWVLPAAFVDGARLPLVLDPLFEPTRLVSGTDDAIECDIAQRIDAFTGTKFYFAWTRRYSSADTDVYGCWTGLGIGGVTINAGTLVAFEAGALASRRPRVGVPAFAGEVLVVWQQSSGPLGSRDLVMAGTVTSMAPPAVTYTKTATVPLAATADDERDAETSWELHPLGSRITVLYRSGVGLRLAGVQLPFTGQQPPTVTDDAQVPNSANASDAAISRSADGNGWRLIAFRQPGSLSDDLVLRAIDTDRNVLGAPLTVGSSILDESQPAVDGELLAFARRESTLSGARRDLLLARIGITGAGPTVLVAPTALSATGDDEYAPTVARTNLRYCVAYVRAEDVHGTLVEPDCTTCNAPFVVGGLDPSKPREQGPRLAGAYRAGDTFGFGNRVALVLTEAAATPPFASQVVAQALRDVADVPDPVDLGGGCGSGGLGGFDGEAAVGNRDFVFDLAGGDPSGLHFCGIGLPGPGIACGGCVFTAATSYTFAGSGGTATHPFPIPCTATLAGFQLETQWVSLATTNPCAVIAGIAASNRLLTTIGN